GAGNRHHDEPPARDRRQGERHAGMRVAVVAGRAHEALGLGDRRATGTPRSRMAVGAEPAADELDRPRTPNALVVRPCRVYEQNAADWVVHRKRPVPDSLAPFAARVPRGEPRLDLGCGPGWHTAALGRPAIALDAAKSMLDLVATNAPVALCVQADLEALP